MNWEKLRYQVLHRDEYTCQICLKKHNSLDVHHVIPRCREGLNSMNNLTSVCEDCHSLIELKFQKPKNNCGRKILLIQVSSDLLKDISKISKECGFIRHDLIIEGMKMIREKYKEYLK